MPILNERTLHIGLDDTDSSEGMCTTFLTYQIVRYILSHYAKIRFIDYPNLIRHNPNIPWKTRGNASLVIRIGGEIDSESLFSLCTEYLLRYSTSERANSGLVMFESETIPFDLRDFSRRALYSVLSVKEALFLIRKYGMKHLGLRSKQGLVGALAGIGNTLRDDYTFELIAYRDDVSLPRKLDTQRIMEMDRKSPLTFSNIDTKNGRIMILPNGPDPVLCGVRGETPSAVYRAFQILGPHDNLKGWMIYRSNQGTGEHLQQKLDLSRPRAYYAGWVDACVASKPRIVMGGHVFFKIANNEGEIECACYEPTGELRKVALSLNIGDEIRSGGGIRKSTSAHPKVLNIEYIQICRLAKKLQQENPTCDSCGRRMSSLGVGQGFFCKCGFVTRNARKRLVQVKRSLRREILYLPPVSAQRHLTKPIQRYSLAKKRHFTKMSGNVRWVS